MVFSDAIFLMENLKNGLKNPWYILLEFGGSHGL
jgi:hypothetical protein